MNKAAYFIKVFSMAEKHYGPSSKRLAGEGWKHDWQTLVATILSAQTRDETTIPVAVGLFKRYPKVEMLAKAKVAKTEQKQIIDVQVQCYKILSTEGGNKALTEVCFNQDGIIMSIAINAKLFQAIFEAKSYSTNAPSDAFILPAIVTKDEKAPKTKEAPALPPKPKSGRNTALTIISNPSGASVYLDDSFIGIAPISVQAPLGIHLVKCTLEGYVDAYTSVGVTEEGADAGVAGAEATCNMKR